MADDLNAVPDLGRAMTVVKMKVISLERLHHLDVATQLPIVISGNDHHLAARHKSPQKLRRFARRRFVVDQITEEDELPRGVFVHQGDEPFRNGRHSPHRNETARRTLTQFISEMQVRDGEPPLTFVKKRQSAIQKNFIGDQRLIRSQPGHWQRIGC